ncbi:hypothetical protein BU16DRAFT_597572 [Lophium mytilinum]|uniref:Uncharacterized protein n=1 Tax=Lophium mytilinum TaxID=390894 RepID=A0A6A6QEQ9_9PEZI|nr:hypothetical protein BU16DRAFT_597572 [Lophium mytilinum]
MAANTSHNRNAAPDITTMSRDARRALLLSPKLQVQIHEEDTTRPVRKIPIAVLTAFSARAKKHYDTQTCDPRITGEYLKLDAIASVMDWMIESCESLEIEPIQMRGWLGGNIELYMAAAVLDIPLVKEHMAGHIAPLARENPHLFLDQRAKILSTLPAHDMLVQMVSKGFADGYGEIWMEKKHIQQLINWYPLATGELRQAMPSQNIPFGFAEELLVFVLFAIMAWGPTMWFVHGIWTASLDDLFLSSSY